MLTIPLLALLLSAHADPEPPASSAADWRAAEAPFLTRHVQLTFPDRFVRAGEQYFDHQSPPQWVIFQAVERPAEGHEPDANYAMYVAKLTRDAGGHITGLDAPVRISPQASANTCGWFHPTEPNTAIFGSTILAPSGTDSPGYSRDRQRYTWQFPKEMEIVRIAGIDRLAAAQGLDSHARDMKQRFGSQSSLLPGLSGPAPAPQPVFSRPGYDAECSYSRDGRFLLYTHVDPTNNDPNIWICDTETGKHYPIVTAKGYDGGPFFSPDGKWICYRSDRKGNNVLQLFIAELAFGDDGDSSIPIGVAREIQLTHEQPGVDEKQQAVSWCPYFHPSGKYLVYATSEIGHDNYEVFALGIDLKKPPQELQRTRVTFAPGFDGLPVFSDDGALMMWTSQRGQKREGEARPSSQMWLAEVTGEPSQHPR